MDKAPFSKHKCQVDPTNFLSAFSAATYSEPRLLLKHRCRVGLGMLANSQTVHTFPDSGLHQGGNSADLVRYLKQWNEAKRLYPAPVGNVPEHLRGKLFSVFKDAQTHRVVFNRIPQNNQEVHIPGYTQHTTVGHDLVELEVPPDI